MSKHTAGPWVVSASSPFLIRAGNDTTGRHIAHTGPASYHPSFEVDEPNARPIAAAPDLLEALEECLGWLEWLYHPDHDDEKKSSLSSLKRARAAIAKATGEDQ